MSTQRLLYIPGNGSIEEATRVAIEHNPLGVLLGNALSPAEQAGDRYKG